MCAEIRNERYNCDDKSDSDEDDRYSGADDRSVDGVGA